MPKRRDRLEEKIENWLTIGLFIVCVLVIVSVIGTAFAPERFGFPTAQNGVYTR